MNYKTRKVFNRDKRWGNMALFNIVAKKLGYNKKEVGCVIQCALNTIAELVATGHSLQINDFGIFTTKIRSARERYDFRARKMAFAPASRKMVFIQGKFIKQLIEEYDASKK